MAGDTIDLSSISNESIKIMTIFRPLPLQHPDRRIDYNIDTRTKYERDFFSDKPRKTAPPPPIEIIELDTTPLSRTTFTNIPISSPFDLTPMSPSTIALLDEIFEDPDLSDQLLISSA